MTERSGARVLVLGAGQLGTDLVAALQRLGGYVIAADGHADAAAHPIADEAVLLELTDPEALRATLERVAPDYVVSATDAVAVDALAGVEEAGVPVVPGSRSARLTLDRESLRRLAADELGLPTAPFWFAGSPAELTAVAEHAGFPLVVKPLLAVPGEGQSVLLRAEDIEPAWERAVGGRFSHHRVMVETVVEIDHEITLLAVRSGTATKFGEPIGHRHVDGVLECWQPQQMTQVARDAARSIAARVVNALGGRGVFGVELLVRGDEVYFSDVTAVLPDSALVTLRSQRLSAFELQARAVLGLPLDTIMISPAAAEVSYRTEPVGTANVGAALQVPESDIRLFAEPTGSARPGRHRSAVVLATGTDVPQARDRVRRAVAALRGGAR